MHCYITLAFPDDFESLAFIPLISSLCVKFQLSVDFHYSMAFKLPVMYCFFSSSSSLKRQTKQMDISKLRLLDLHSKKNPLPISKYFFNSNIIPEGLISKFQSPIYNLVSSKLRSQFSIVTLLICCPFMNLRSSFVHMLSF